MLEFGVVVAIDKNNGIGFNGQLPWNLPGDLKRFKEITTRTNDPSLQNAVVMGRRTWESIPEKFRPLPQRINAVLTRDRDFKFSNGILVFSSLEDCLERMQSEYSNKRIERGFFIGGEKVFAGALNHPLCHRLYMTRILGSFKCDTFFPSFQDDFRLVSTSEKHSENSIEYVFEEYSRIV